MNRITGKSERQKRILGISDEPNMTLRDYFAAKAMQGMVSVIGEFNLYNVCETAYRIADAMLAERDK